MIPRLNTPETDEIVSNYDLIKQIPFTGTMTPGVCLGRCLCDQYHVLLGIHDGKTDAVVIYYVNGTHCNVVGIYARNNLRKYLDMFYDLLKSHGVKKVRSETTRDSDSYAKLFKMTRSYSVYEKDL